MALNNGLRPCASSSSESIYSKTVIWFGMFSRTIRLLEAGIKPVYSRREDAIYDLAKATKIGNKEDIEKFSKRTVKVTPQHNDDWKKLLRLMGVHVVEAPSKAEAQCAAFCKAEKYEKYARDYEPNATPPSFVE